MNVLLVTPPMTHINTPYPATAYLKSYLKSLNCNSKQIDLSLELALKIFSENGLKEIYSLVKLKKKKSDAINFFIDAFDDYSKTIDSVIEFLQGKNLSLALRISKRNYLPEGPRFLFLQEYKDVLLSQFGELGTHDQAKYLASLYLDDIVDVIREGIDSEFQFSRYAERLASSEASFTKLYQRLLNWSNQSLIDQWIIELFKKHFQSCNPDIVAITVPFPGNMYSSLVIGKWVKSHSPNTKVVIGGGFVNTELRNIQDIRIFEFVDYISYDDGEKPIELLISSFQNGKEIQADKLLRTKFLKDNKILNGTFVDANPLRFKNNPGPDYSDFSFEKYVSMFEMPNPMHRMWSGYRWNKMMLAHGCYWKKCSFCDTSLDYIQKFEPGRVETLVDQMIQISKRTDVSGFHFVDEAAPPALLKALSLEIIKRKLNFVWWGNLRFDIQFDYKLCQLMADAGCVAVTGGLEVASPRLLKLINKGINLEQVTKVINNIHSSGIYVHAYLMYGFPSQTIQETVDSLEIVRQLFKEKYLDSAHWHRFIATIHSDVGMFPGKYNIKLNPIKADKYGLFAQYEVPFTEENEIDHEILGKGLSKALYNYMHGIGLDEDVRVWFDIEVPRTKINKKFIKQRGSNDT